MKFSPLLSIGTRLRSFAASLCVILSVVFPAAFGLEAAARVVAWGDNTYGQTNVPADLTNIVAIAAGRTHHLALRRDGTVRAWGANTAGETLVPAGLTNVVAIAAGDTHSVALTASGKVVVWGDSHGGPLDQHYQTVDLGSLTGALEITAAGDQTYIVKEDRSLIGWGLMRGQHFSLPDWQSDSNPFRWSGQLSNILEVASSGGLCLALRENGNLFTWWDGEPWGALSGGWDLSLPDLGSVVDIACGAAQYYFLEPNGTLKSWSFLAVIQLKLPTDPGNLTAIAAGDYHLLALTPRGTLKAWSAVQTSVPEGLSGVVAIAASGSQSLALVGDGPPWIRLISRGRTVCAGTDLQLRAQVSGAWPLACQWRRDGRDLPGATNSVLCLSDLQLTQTGTYVLAVSNAFGTTLSTNLQLDVEPFLFLGQPQPSQTLPRDATTGIGVSVQGQGTIQYQWRLNGTALVGATNAWLPLANVQPAQTGTYSALVSNEYGARASADAVLNVVPAIIVSQPQNQVLLENGSATFTVAPSGSGPFAYQWQFNGVDLPGETNSTLILADLRLDQQGDYTVVVSNSYGSVRSAAASLAPPTLVAWGANPYGQINLPANAADAVAVAAGYGHSLALSPNGMVTAWGHNNAGQASVPSGLSNVVAIAAGDYHSLALQADGRLAAWGWNSSGQASVPAGLSPVVAIASGGDFNLALEADGTLQAWGDNLYGQTSVPANLSLVVAIAAGQGHSLALEANGTVKGWGRDFEGQATPPTGLARVTAIAAGGYHSLALLTDGTVTAWGDNSMGQTTVPAGLTNAVAIATGWESSFAITAAGALVVWGLRDTNAAIPPADLSRVHLIASGWTHFLAICGEPAAPPTITGLTRNAATRQLRFTTLRGHRYDLQYQAALADPTWRTVHLPPVPGDGGPKALSDPDPSAPQRFYRVRLR